MPPAQLEAAAGSVAPVAMAPEALPTDPRRRRRWLRGLVVTGTLATLPVAGAALPAFDPLGTGAPRPGALVTPHEDRLLLTLGAATEARTDAVVQADAETAPAGPVPLAQVDGVDLVVPAAADLTALIGFHEANGHSTETLVPSGPAELGDLADAPPARDPSTGAPPAMLLPSRQRGSDPASAVDVAVPEGVEVTAPVTGEVTSVTPYALYGTYADTRIEIAPEGRPDLRVVVLHVSDPHVAAGDRVVAGETPLAASSTAFPFASQIDRFTTAAAGAPTPHVHLEVKRVA